MDSQFPDDDTEFFRNWAKRAPKLAAELITMFMREKMLLEEELQDSEVGV